MTKEAQNCLLKTLEEPQEYVVIILIASNENNILATVKSRCTKLFFENISDDDIQKYLKEKIGDVQFEKSMIKLSIMAIQILVLLCYLLLTFCIVSP